MSAPRRSIQILPEQVVHKIAAGEVVERPLSVVKELVENSIDAGATKIHVEIEQGGCQSIIVSDNGIGIRPQEMPLAMKRHATSKITQAEDLFSIHTLGFRGEALPSIASVSHFRIESATDESAPVGYALEVQQGHVSGLQETAMPRGTRVIVRDLFCTTPARLKFLKRPETEWGHIDDYLTAMALNHLEVEWRLDHHQKQTLFCPAVVGKTRQRILDIFGKEAMEALYPVQREVSEVSLDGLISHPNFSQKSNRRMYVFVNGRYIQDRLINHAIVSGYRGLLMTQQFPMVILNIQIDPSLVDVNVHPTKREVRFSNSNVIHHLISETIRHALERAPWRVAPLPEGEEPALSLSKGARRAGEGEALAEQVPSLEKSKLSIQQALSDYMSRHVTASLADGRASMFDVRSPIFEKRPQAKIGTLAFSNLQLIGQLNSTYLVCENGGSLILIDQHAAHERIGFEQLKTSYLNETLAHQTLLHPLSFELSESESHVLREYLPQLEKFGLIVDEFGEKSFVLKAHPSLLEGCDGVSLIKELVAKIEGEGRLQVIEDRIEHILATMACHRQIRAGDMLEREEMLALLLQLEGTPRSYHCPHGRPVMVEVESREIERWFKRVI